MPQVTSDPPRCNPTFGMDLQSPKILSMSIPVEISQLELELRKFGFSAFLLTVREDATSHVAHMSFELVDDELRCAVSRTAAKNVQTQPKVVLLWPPFEVGGYSMILDATCVAEEEMLRITPVSGVLHRPAQAEEPNSGACESDCAPLGT